MAIAERQVRNKRNNAGELTGRPGVVYDVNVKYKSNGVYRTYTKKGFATKRDASQHEAAMRQKLVNPSYTPLSAAQRKVSVREYLTEWIERHGNTNLRPSTKASYESYIRNHIVPYIGDVPLSQVSAVPFLWWSRCRLEFPQVQPLFLRWRLLNPVRGYCRSPLRSVPILNARSFSRNGKKL